MSNGLAIVRYNKITFSKHQRLALLLHMLWAMSLLLPDLPADPAAAPPEGDPGELINPSPQVFERAARPARHDYADDDVSAQRVFDLVRDINDPEHPLSLEQLNVVEEGLIEPCTVCGGRRRAVQVKFRPTVPHCSMATLIGLAIRVQLMRNLPSDVRLNVAILEGTHNTEEAINKQLADKERVAAALENPYLMGVIDDCLAPRE